MLLAADPISANTLVTVIIAVIGSSVFGSAVQGVINRRKTSSESELNNAQMRKVSQETTSALIGDLRTEISRKDAEHTLEMKELRLEVVALRERLDVTERKLATSEARADRAEQTGLVLGRRLSKFQERVTQLEKVLEDAGLTIPPWPEREEMI